jgi:hypothetical protein
MAIETTFLGDHLLSGKWCFNDVLMGFNGDSIAFNGI